MTRLIALAAGIGLSAATLLAQSSPGADKFQAPKTWTHPRTA